MVPRTRYSIRAYRDGSSFGRVTAARAHLGVLEIQDQTSFGRGTY